MIATTDDVRKGMNADDFDRFRRVGHALTGMPADRAVALLMSMICEVIDQGRCPELWRAIARGAQEEINLAGRKGAPR